MDDIVKSSGSGLIGLFHNKKGDISIPKPFERDIFLFDTHIAGTSHIEGIEELEPFLKDGDRLLLLREADNEYDDLAVLIKTMDGIKLGYIPRKHNAVFARLMDAGKELYAEIVAREKQDSWIKIDIKIYLHE